MKLKALLVFLSLFGGGSNAVAQEFSVVPKEGFIVLDNGTDIRATVAPDKGGELASLSVLYAGSWHELLYRALDYSDRPGWRGKAPLLWPATGVSVLEDGQTARYELAGASYKMPFHGFARKQHWQLIEKGQSADMASVTLQMTDNATTRRYYPFGFDLQVEYRLQADQLSMLYKLTADAGNSGSMPFSIGNHITFNAPLVKGSEAATLLFENDFPDHLITGANKAFAGVVEPSIYRGLNSLQDLPTRKSVSLSGSKKVAELTIYDPSGLGLRLRHQNSGDVAQPAIQFNLWADTSAGFFSPEPWVGTQNSLNTGMGIISLRPGHSWQWQIDITPLPQAIHAEEM